jgi:neutral trehalase
MSQRLTNDLSSVRAEFEAWRARRKGRERIPEQLWEQALGLLKEYPVKVVCRELKLSPPQVRNRRQGKENRQRGEKFLELTPRDLVQMPGVVQSERIESEGDQTRGRCRVVIERRDGSRFSVSLGEDPVSLQSLVMGFVRA